uniref:Uncharacterized protein LOC104222452 n=1 Tax=Nicotiana sylvestris TaxID=4096 RepID=A0A1U7W458_NICSY|nr:PREDICTED: uncharacterized protein LOC104222452 [Nicotiana sylvestris]
MSRKKLCMESIGDLEGKNFGEDMEREASYWKNIDIGFRLLVRLSQLCESGMPTQKPISSSTEVSTSYQFNGEFAEQTVALRGCSSSIFRTGSTSGTCAEQNDITMHNTANRVDMLLDMEAELLEKKETKKKYCVMP